MPPVVIPFEMNQSPPIWMSDISAYNSDRRVSPIIHFNFDDYQERGGTIICIRGGVNDAGVDYEFDYNAAECHDRGIYFKVYHAVKLWKNLDTQAKIIQDVIEQAEFSPYYIESDFDIEINDGLSKTQMTSNYTKLDQKVIDRVNEMLGVYTRGYWWNANFSRSDLPKKRRLWVAHHWTGIDPFQVPKVRPYIPDDWGAINNPVTPTWWQIDTYDNGYQFGSRGEDEIDMNLFTLNGATSKAFEDHYGFALTEDPPPPIPEPPPPKPGATIVMKMTAEKWNVRAGPGTYFGDVGDLFKDEIVEIEGNMDGKDAWAKIVSGRYAGKYFAVSWANSSGVIIRASEPV